ncbi:pilus biosynthesis protein [Thiohalobacter sp. COW1]|uniref:TfP pilus assembly protein, tip-associated adhesin PilY1 n=1 Tax=Thiohalobacter thiocyanaticus TaxID=585455 RepID=A0A1Z4VQ13_9GAMM|nr:MULTISPECIES: PilC/PilY family type IV pilus protein [Thiohalobacter]BAZ93314.1 TfP pilus assembly protein, tip-associated adhesin PilY1 [Thiohalobacter thiocyanaticus]BCO31644.1 pilus biosynthesis protein [Thiohalobacter sp. COW1]
MAIAWLGLSAPAWGALDLSDAPLFLTTNADPNIMFTLDDSGSMQWELMPDDLIYSYYLYPRASGIYGSSDYSNWVVSFDDSYGYTAVARSHDVNAIYYNPEITYKPWAEADGSLYPDATPSCAPHNPENTGAGCRDLTSTNSAYAGWDSCTSRWSCSYSTSTRSFWPAVYYKYDGTGNIWNTSNYTKVEIRSGSTYTGSSERTDCAAAPTCTYAEEIQNFANWYTYYRSRILAARAGVGRAFSQQSEAMRVGFATINQGSKTVDGVSSPGTIIKGVRPFNGSDRADFFDNLYGHDIPTAGTPLRRALDDVGQYFMRSDNSGPWGEAPGTNDSTPQLTCRQSYNILMTDGYWAAGSARTSAARANVDNSTGPSITGPGGASYQYTPEHPYSDSHSNTLADVAMYYWNRDLRPGLANKVPTNTADPAFWQHLVNFTVGLGVNGTLDPSTDLAGLEAGTTSWPQPSTSGSGANIDDLWHAALNSRGDFFSAADPDTFADALTASLNSIVGRSSSASAITSNSTRLDTDTNIYQARFDSSDWTGELYAYEIESDGSVGNQAWKATDNIPAAASRSIFTLNSTSSNGVTFEWGNLSSSQQTDLDTNILGVDDGLGQDRLAYLRGDQSQELKNGGNFRNRSSVLGDIINSDPLFVGTPDYGYALLSDPEGTDYTTFRDNTAYKNRQGMLYFGANDGMLHALNADSGAEVFTYVPSFLFPELSDLTSPDYAHKYYVDGSARAGDAYINGVWRTVLLGSAGAGGRGIFALDVTYPGTFDAGDVLWEYTHADLGYTIGQPTIVRLNDDSWAALFGNGYNSDNHKAMLFLVDLETGNLIKAIDTEVGSSASPNGLATPVPVDVDGNRTTDYVYAGDLHGNLWKFDLTGSNSNQWEIAFKQGNTPKPLFVAVDGSGNTQPITIRPAVGNHPDSGRMVYFGTGKYIEIGDNVVGLNPQVQTFYGIWDNDNDQVDRGDLLEQTILAEIDATTAGLVSDVRAISNNTADWNSHDGWYLDLESPVSGAEGERVISAPLLRHGRIIFPTVIPSADVCDYGGSSWLMEMNALSGARLAYSVFDMNGDGKVDDKDYVTLADGSKVPVSGTRFDDMIDTPAIISAGEKEYKYTSGSSGSFDVITEKGSVVRGRQSWRQLK